MLSKPMKRLLRYAASVDRVRAWPDDIQDRTIRTARRQGFLDTFEHINPWMHVEGFGKRITDEITDKGRRALKERP